MDNNTISRDQLGWLRLLGASPTVPNTSPERFYAVLHATPNARPWIASEWREDEPVAAIVGRASERTITHRFAYGPTASINTRCIDIVYGGVLSNGSDVASDWIVNRIIQELASRRVDAIIVHHLRSDHDVVERLLAQWRCQIVRREPHYRLRLASSHESHLATMSRKHRYNVTRADRLLVQALGNVSVRVVTTTTDIEQFAHEASTITSAGYQGKLGVGFQATAAQVAAMRAEADAGRLLCYGLYVGDAQSEMIAYWIGCAYNEVYYGESTAYNPKYREFSPGSVLLQRVIKDLISRGMGVFDYGYGDAPYKRLYSSDSWEESTHTLYANTMRGRIAWMLAYMTKSAKLLAYRGGSYGQRVKTQWRRRLER